MTADPATAGGLILAVCGVTILVHELAHAAVAVLVFRLPVRLSLNLRGPGIIIGSDAIRLTRTQIVCTAVAGPAANLALAAAAYEAGIGILVLTGVFFAFANLIPFKHSDGHRILHGYPTLDPARPPASLPSLSGEQATPPPSRPRRPEAVRRNAAVRELGLLPRRMRRRGRNGRRSPAAVLWFVVGEDHVDPSLAAVRSRGIRAAR